MAITDRQRELRKRHLGSSDAAAIMGLSPWASPMDVFIEKTQDVAPLQATDAMEIGNVLEGAIIDWTLKRMSEQMGPCEAARNQRRVHANGVMAANLDCLAKVHGAPVPVEVKFSSDVKQWGDEAAGFDGIPIQYATQVLHQMAVVSARRAVLGVFLSGFRPEFRLYWIEGVDDSVEGLERFECEWWEKHVLAGVPPQECEPASLETLARVQRVEGKTVELPADIVRVWRDADAAKKAAEKAADEAKARVLAELGDAEVGACPLGVLTYKLQKRAAYTVAANEFRMARFTAAKAGKVGAT